jgi:hypothetical protein
MPARRGFQAGFGDKIVTIQNMNPGSCATRARTGYFLLGGGAISLDMPERVDDGAATGFLSCLGFFCSRLLRS